MDDRVQRKSILLGLDGATWDLLGPWADDGTLPNLHKLRKEGVWGELASTVPCTTPPAWSACVTGCNPGKHGVYDFRESPLNRPSRPLITGQSIRCDKLWHMFNRLGSRTGVLNVPITYPPEKIDGFMVSGMMTPSKDVAYTYPQELKDELLEAIGDYVPNIDIPRYDVELPEDAEVFLADMEYCFTKRVEALLYLLDNHEWDFFMAVFVLPDRIQHLFWKYLDAQFPQYKSEFGEWIRPKIIECYRLLDDMVGEVMARVDDKTDLYVMSDHGFGGTDAWINVNTWLEREGYLKLHPGQALKKRLFYAGVAANDLPWVKLLIPKWMQSAIRGRIRGKRSSFITDLGDTIDWERTRAFFASIPCQGLFINVKRHDPDTGQTIGIVEKGTEYDRLRAELISKLENFRDPESGVRIVDWVKRREDLYEGEQAQYAPDIVFVARNYAYLARQFFGDWKIVRHCEEIPNGFHRPNGVFAAYGKNFRAGHIVKDAEIVDIAPTLLHGCGLPVPPSMDGKVLRDIFTESYDRTHPIRRGEIAGGPAALNDDKDDVYTEDEEAIVMKRLRDLGYLD